MPFCSTDVAVEGTTNFQFLTDTSEVAVTVSRRVNFRPSSLQVTSLFSPFAKFVPDGLPVFAHLEFTVATDNPSAPGRISSAPSDAGD